MSVMYTGGKLAMRRVGHHKGILHTILGRLLLWGGGDCGGCYVCDILAQYAPRQTPFSPPTKMFLPTSALVHFIKQAREIKTRPQNRCQA
jgi:hypothetical protein